MTEQDTRHSEHPDDADQGEIGRDPAALQETSIRLSEGGWAAFTALRDVLGPMPEDFLADRQQHSERRDPFADPSAFEGSSDGRQA